MDLNTISEVSRPTSREEIGAWRDGDAWLAGGTWLFSEPQPGLRRLIDLERLGWEPLSVSEQGLSIAATCPAREGLPNSERSRLISTLWTLVPRSS